MKINKFEYKYDGTKMNNKEFDIDISKFGGVIFVKRDALFPCGTIMKKYVEYSQFCTNCGFFEHNFYDYFKDKFDDMNYIHYKCTNKDYIEMDIYINKELLLSTSYDNGFYTFMFRYDDYWSVACKEDELIEWED